MLPFVITSFASSPFGVTPGAFVDGAPFTTAPVAGSQNTVLYRNNLMITAEPGFSSGQGRVRAWTVDSAGVPTVVGTLTTAGFATNTILNSTAHFGYSIDWEWLAPVNDTTNSLRILIAVGAPGQGTSGVVYLYFWDPATPSTPPTEHAVLNPHVFNKHASRFGASVSVCQYFVFVGAPGDNINALRNSVTPVSGTLFSNAGAVYSFRPLNIQIFSTGMFVPLGNVPQWKWFLEERFKIYNVNAIDNFYGQSIQCKDPEPNLNPTLIIGVPGDDYSTVSAVNNIAWSLTPTLPASTLVPNSNRGHAEVWVRATNGAWYLDSIIKGTVANGELGRNVAIGEDVIAVSSVSTVFAYRNTWFPAPSPGRWDWVAHGTWTHANAIAAIPEDDRVLIIGEPSGSSNSGIISFYDSDALGVLPGTASSTYTGASGISAGSALHLANNGRTVSVGTLGSTANSIVLQFGCRAFAPALNTPLTGAAALELQTGVCLTGPVPVGNTCPHQVAQCLSPNDMDLPSGASTYTCQQTGWVGSPSRCTCKALQITSSQLPNYLLHPTVSTTNGFSFASPGGPNGHLCSTAGGNIGNVCNVAVANCRLAGTTPAPPTPRVWTCTALGWSGVTPFCSGGNCTIAADVNRNPAVGCATLPISQYSGAGGRTGVIGLFHNQQCTLACNPGFAVVGGVSAVRCGATANTVLSIATPVCEAVCAAPTILGGATGCSNAARGGLCVLKCTNPTSVPLLDSTPDVAIRYLQCNAAGSAFSTVMTLNTVAPLVLSSTLPTCYEACTLAYGGSDCLIVHSGTTCAPRCPTGSYPRQGQLTCLPSTGTTSVFSPAPLPNDQFCYPPTCWTVPTVGTCLLRPPFVAQERVPVPLGVDRRDAWHEIVFPVTSAAGTYDFTLDVTDFKNCPSIEYWLSDFTNTGTVTFSSSYNQMTFVAAQTATNPARFPERAGFNFISDSPPNLIPANGARATTLRVVIAASSSTTFKWNYRCYRGINDQPCKNRKIPNPGPSDAKSECDGASTTYPLSHGATCSRTCSMPVSAPTELIFCDNGIYKDAAGALVAECP